MKNRSFILGSLSLILLTAGLTAQSLHAQHAFTVVIPEIEMASQQATVQTPDGGFVVLFNSIGSAEEAIDPEMQPAFLGLMKLSGNGSLEWSRQIRIGIDEANPVSLLQSADGRLIVLSNVAVDIDNHDIVFLTFNPQGYVLSAVQYDMAMYDGIANSLLLDDGSVLVSGSMGNEGIYKPFAMRLSLEGEVLNAQVYPELESRWWSSLGKIKMLSSGSIALVNSIYKEEHPGYETICLIDPDGAVQSATMFDFDAGISDYGYMDYTISDVHQAPDGLLTLLGYGSMTGCSSSHHTGFAAQMKPTGELQKLQFIKSDFSLPFHQFLSTEQNGIRLLAGMGNAPFAYLPVELNEDLQITNARLITPLEVSDEEDAGDWWAWESQPSILRTEDQGMVLTSSGLNYIDHTESPSGYKQSATITRFSPDFTTCSGAEQGLYTDSEGIFFRKQDHGEEAAEASENKQPVFANLTHVTTEITVTPVDLDVNVRTIIDHKTIDFPLEIEIICQDEPMLLSSALPEPGNNIVASNNQLKVSPNVIRQGKDIAMEFTLAGIEAPEITLLTIATGETVRTVEPGTIQWDNRTGRGSAFVNTVGLTPGVYLVRVRSGEKQLTAKVEVQ